MVSSYYVIKISKKKKNYLFLCGEVARRTTTRSATTAAADQTVAVVTAAAVNCGVYHMYAGKLVEKIVFDVKRYVCVFE